MTKTIEKIIISFFYVLNFLVITAFLIGMAWFRLWQADYNLRCFTAQDPATCATIKNK